MAARINTKFILILIIVCGTLGTTAGGWLWYRIRHDAVGKIEDAEAFQAQGDYRNAERMFGKAVGVEPGNLDYVARWEQAIRQVVPTTANEATELYGRYMAIRAYPRDQYPFEAQWHESYIADLAEASKRVSAYAVQYDQAAGRMMEMIQPPDPAAIRSKLYRGLARFHPSMQSSFDDDELREGRRALEEYLQEDPAHAEAWATLVRGRVAMADRLRRRNEPVRSDREYAEAVSALADARLQVDGAPELALAELELLRLERARSGGLEEKDEQRARALLLLLSDAARTTDDGTLLASAVDQLLYYRWLDGGTKPSAILDSYLLRHPTDYLAMVQAAKARRFDAAYEGARELLTTVLDAELLPVSFMSQFQGRLRTIAAQELVLVGLTQWELAEPAERPMHVERMEAARARLVEVMGEATDDPMVIEADARIAFAKSDFNGAASRFDRLVTDFGQTDIPTLLGAALSLERMNQIGRALDHVDRGLAIDPQNPDLLERRAIYLVRMRRYEEAAVAARVLTQVAPERPVGHEVLRDMQSRLGIEAGTEVDDEVQVVFVEVSQMLQARRADDAMDTLARAMEQYPDDPRVIYALMMVHWEHGDKDFARELLQRGLTEYPEQRQFAQFQATFAIEDPVQRIVDFVRSEVADPTEQSIEIVATAYRARRQYEAGAARAEREGDEAAALVAREQMGRMLELMAEHRAIVLAEAPRHPRYVRFAFDEAMELEDWTTVEEMIAIAQADNVDQVEGRVFLGRYELVRGENAKAAETLAVAAERLPFDARIQMWLAQANEGLGRYDEALDAFEVAYRNNPNDIAVLLPYINLLEITGDANRALLILQNARRLQLSDVMSNELRNQWLMLEARVGDPAVVLRDRRDMHDTRREVLDVDPIARQNARALIEFLVRQTPAPNTILARSGQPRYTPREWARLSGPDQDRIRRETRRAWDAEVDEIVSALADPMQRGLIWHNLKATVLRLRGDVDGGESVLREMLAGDIEDGERLRGYIMLSAFLQAVDRLPQAVAALREAQQYQDPTRLEADRALAAMLMSLGQYGQAYIVLETVHATLPSREIEFDIIRCLSNVGRVAEAREWLGRVTATQNDEFSLRLLDAGIMQVEMELAASGGDQAEATRVYDELGVVIAALRESGPTQSAPFVMEAQRHLNRSRRTGDKALLDLALRELNAADGRTADTRRIAMVRIEVLKEQGNRPQAIIEYRQLLAGNPDDRESRMALVELLVAEKRVPEAIDTLADAVRRSPGSAFWHEQFADMVRQVNGDLNIAVEHYRLAVEAMRSPSAIAKLTSTLLALPQPDANAALRYLEQYEAELGDGPEPIIVRARALAIKGDRAAALADLKLAYARFAEFVDSGRRNPVGITTWIVAARDVIAPRRAVTRADAEATEALVREMSGGDLDLFRLRALALIWRSVGDTELTRAIDLQRQAVSLAVGPNESRRSELLFTLGSFLHAAGEERAALDAYEEIIGREPDNARALNNAAYYLAESLGDLDGAMAYAQRAVDILPGDASLRDTLGWIQFRKGDYAEAKQNLFRSVQLAETAVNNYHLAAVYAREGDAVNARRYIDRALQLEPDSETRTEIDRLADDI